MRFPTRTLAGLALGAALAGGQAVAQVKPEDVLARRPVQPNVQITGVAPGAVLVRALYIRGNHLRPYEFEVRLKPPLDSRADVTITKDQYDLVMNVLNWFHPLGVEVRTGRLRTHVVELGDLNAGLSPAYTFPVYRKTGLVLPNPLKNPSQGLP